ncbi:hypothetical protein Tco_1152999 [Tanacetum coccineum]
MIEEDTDSPLPHDTITTITVFISTIPVLCLIVPSISFRIIRAVRCLLAANMMAWRLGRDDREREPTGLDKDTDTDEAITPKRARRRQPYLLSHHNITSCITTTIREEVFSEVYYFNALLPSSWERGKKEGLKKDSFEREERVRGIGFGIKILWDGLVEDMKGIQRWAEEGIPTSSCFYVAQSLNDYES